MALTDDERKLLEELTRRSQEPDADDTFEVEIFNGSKGARLPFSQAKTWLETELGISFDPPPPAGGKDGQGEGGQGEGGEPPGSKYFGKRSRGPTG